MENWRAWRYVLFAIFGAVVFFNFGISSVADMTLQTEIPILKGITIQTVLGIASLIGIWILWKKL